MKGKVLINGFDIDTEYVLAMKSVGMCFDQFLLYDNLTGFENLKLIYDLVPKDCYPIKEVLEIVNLSKESDKKVKQYSSGMKQRLALARTILKKPKIIILDEPINMLDPRGMKELYILIAKLAETGTAFLISSHMLFDVEKHCDKVVFMKEGKVKLFGTVKELLKKKTKNLEDIYMECC